MDFITPVKSSDDQKPKETLIQPSSQFPVNTVEKRPGCGPSQRLTLRANYQVSCYC